MDKLQALTVFRHVAELDSFAETARRLALSPPVVSKCIADLEARLGTRLLNRTTRRVSLTQEGRLFLDYVKRGLDTLDEAENTLLAARGTPEGKLRVSAPMTVTLTKLSSALPQFLSKYPGISLDLHLDDRRVDMLRDGFDMAIRGSDNLEDSSLVARKLAVMPHVVCASPAYFAQHGRPIAPRDLKSHECVRFSLSGHPDVWSFERGGQSERVQIDARYSVASSLAVRDALRAGFGLSLIPLPYVIEDIEEERLEVVLDDWKAVETTIYAVYPSRQYVAPKLRVFLDFLIEQFGK